MLTIIEMNPTKALLDEIMAIEKSRELLYKNLDEAPKLENYCETFFESMGGQEFLARIPRTSQLKILDIGFGRGETSLYLASQGHQVHSIEPSPLNCQLLQATAKKFGLEKNIKIYQTPAEHLDQIEEAFFGLCLFNSSLHHCDDPARVLKICKNKLVKNGRVIAINEPILKFYQTKRWFYKTLIENPVKLGHYGGNEHIYYHHEYKKFLEGAGLKVSAHFHVRHLYPRQVLKENISRNVDGRSVFSDKKLWIKFTILLGIKYLSSNLLTKWFVIMLGKRLSLFAFSFEGKNLEIENVS